MKNRPRGQGKTTLTCPICGKEFTKYVAQITSPIVYCSCSCRGKAKGGELHSNWRGGKTVGFQGYVLIKVGDKYLREHRLVMETHLGRKLSTDEHVHHKNRVKTDNRIENLEVVSNHDHAVKHGFLAEYRKTAPSKKLTRWSLHYPACVVCGKTTSIHQAHGECNACYKHRRYHSKRIA